MLSRAYYNEIDPYAARWLPGMLICADNSALSWLYGDNEFDSVVTDPPYGLKFMGKRWDYDVPSVDTWREVLRVLKPGGYLLAFGGSRTYHRVVCAIEDAGFEIRDCMMWLYGSGFPKSHNLGGEHEGWGTALKPAHEPIVLARKPLIGTVAKNVRAYGTGALNIDGCRVEGEGGHVRVGEASQDRRYANAGATTFALKPGPRGGDPQGRWPANLIHDGSEEVLEVFPYAPGQLSPSGEDGTPQRNLVYGALRHVGPTHLPRIEVDKSAARFFYCAKASRAERDGGCDALPDREGGIRSETSGQHITRRDGGAPAPVKNNHPTVKPLALMRYLCKLVTPPGGLILDPFAGSGSTVCAATLEGFRCVGIEREKEFCEIARERVQHWASLVAC